jgi:ribokinase
MARPIPRVVCVGSLNIDLIASVARLPRAGETIAAKRLTRRFGGKGANQAVAAARQGARVSFVGCVGADAEGDSYRQHLAGENVDCHGLMNAPGEATGIALIAVDAAGENHIVVAAGANGGLHPQQVREQGAAIEKADILLVQLEVPLPAVLEAITIANRAGVPVVFTPAPWQPDFPWGHHSIDVVIVNAEEAQAMFHRPVNDVSPKTTRAIQPLLGRFRASKIIVTRGAQPTLCFLETDAFEVGTLRVAPVDTVGAGDAFAGTFATGLAGGLPLRDTITRANCAGALATLKEGAQEALPNAAEVDQAMREIANL